jgi:hypothetical protein
MAGRYMVCLFGLKFGNGAWGPGAARTRVAGGLVLQYAHNNRELEGKSCLRF